MPITERKLYNLYRELKVLNKAQLYAIMHTSPKSKAVELCEIYENQIKKTKAKIKELEKLNGNPNLIFRQRKEGVQ